MQIPFNTWSGRERKKEKAQNIPFFSIPVDKDEKRKKPSIILLPFEEKRKERVISSISTG